MPSGSRNTRRPRAAAAWRDPAFLYLRTANVMLRACLALARAGLFPGAAARTVLGFAQTLADRGAAARARVISRRRQPWR
jgi:hypothetical protein